MVLVVGEHTHPPPLSHSQSRSWPPRPSHPASILRYDAPTPFGAWYMSARTGRRHERLRFSPIDDRMGAPIRAAGI